MQSEDETIRTLVDVRRVGLLADLAPLLLLARLPGGGSGFRGLLRGLGALSRLGWSLGSSRSRGLAGSGSGFGCHCMRLESWAS